MDTLVSSVGTLSLALYPRMVSEEVRYLLAVDVVRQGAAYPPSQVSYRCLPEFHQDTLGLKPHSGSTLPTVDYHYIHLLLLFWVTCMTPGSSFLRSAV